MTRRCEYSVTAIGGGRVTCARVATREARGRLMCRAHAREPIAVSEVVTPDGMVVRRSQVRALRGERPATREEISEAFWFGPDPYL